MTQLSNFKFLHVTFNDKFIPPFIDWYNTKFSITENMFIWRKFLSYEEPSGENVIQVQHFKPIKALFDQAEKIICHSLFDIELVYFLFNNPEYLKKAYWYIWGGDIYQAPQDPINTFIRKNMKGYLTIIPQDNMLVLKKYNPSAKIYTNIRYGSFFFNDLIKFSPKRNKNYYAIQINNSCDQTALDALDLIEKFKNENVRIYSILSYGDLNLKNEIIQKGTKLFGDKFIYFDQFIPRMQFYKHLCKIDVLLMNQNRQQGLGNTNFVVYQGGKVFFRSHVNIDYYQSLNCTVYPIDSIPDLNFHEFISIDEQIQKENKKNLYHDVFDLDFLYKQWYNFLYS